MFKSQAPSVFRRGFSLFRHTNNSSTAPRVARRSHGTTQAQRVYLKNRFFTKSRMIGGAVAATGAYAFVLWVDGLLEDIELEKEEEVARAARSKKQENRISGETGADTDQGREVDDDEDEEEEEEEEEEEDEEEGLFFFPTGLSRPKPRTYYKASDPEWQEFIRLQRDSKQMMKIRRRLVFICRAAISGNPTYIRQLGKVDVTKGSVWLEIKWPEGPHLEYERPGYELTNELNFRKATRDIHPAHHRLIERAIYPSAVAEAFYFDSKRKATLMWPGFGTYMGWTEPTLEAAQKVTQKPTVPPVVPKSPPPFSASASSTPAPPAPHGASTDKSPSSTDSLTNSAAERFSLTLPDPEKGPMLDLSYFRRRWILNHNKGVREKYFSDPPRGCFLVTGLIDVVGEHRKMTVDVVAVYDPKKGDYVIAKPTIRHIVDRRQLPKGGPG